MTLMKELYQFKKIFRDLEISTNKCVHLNVDLEFNKTFQTNGIFPKYYHIYI